MIELYFLLYRIPVMMTRLARERKRSALAWSLIAIAAWIGAEVAVLFVMSIIYAVVAVLLEWPLELSVGMRFVTYFIALGAAILSVTLVRKYLISITADHSYPSLRHLLSFDPFLELY